MDYKDRNPDWLGGRNFYHNWASIIVIAVVAALWIAATLWFS